VGEIATMNTPFHAGELAVQRRAGVQAAAARIGTGIRPTIPTAAQAFLRLQRMVIVGSIGSGGRVWTSLLAGEPGFATVLDERTVDLAATPPAADPLHEYAEVGAMVGLLAIDLAQRKRLRMNGQITVRTAEAFRITTQQVYANCAKYIHARELHPTGRSQVVPRLLRQTSTLSETQRAWIGRADTFFIASAHPVGGVDVSHRGGHPGFVRVVDATRLVFPDYAGNTMFQTLGNITENPHAGLLFIDFERGDTLQLTGQARVLWDDERTAEFAGAERLVAFDVEMIIEMADTSPLRGELLQYSPFNPT
jgi:predicted pyridoxine 5'-phosphate oxidase superfamily flavin-nucleotide-binding protein